MISRRNFIKGCGVSAATGLAAAYSAFDLSPDGVTGAITTETVTVLIPHLPQQFDGYRIGFITDLHLGIWVPESWILSAFDIVRAAGCELLVLGGDYIGIPENPVWEMAGFVRNHVYAGIPRTVVMGRIFKRVAEIASSYTFADGTVAVPGNHEHWNSTQEFLKAFSPKQGFTLLINQPFTVTRKDERLVLFGTDDYLTGIPRLPKFTDLPSKANASSNILISHNPDLVSYGLARDRDLFPFELSLCGHTHGGQVALPLIGPPTYQIGDPRFGEGLVRLHGKNSYTSRGLGVVAIPFRLNCPPEVTVIQLARA